MMQAAAGRAWSGATRETQGIVGWLLTRFERRARPAPRLAVLERITLAPRQSLALIEAEGRKLLVATSPDAAPAFYALDAQSVEAPADLPGRRGSC